MVSLGHRIRPAPAIGATYRRRVDNACRSTEQCHDHRSRNLSHSCLQSRTLAGPQTYIGTLVRYAVPDDALAIHGNLRVIVILHMETLFRDFRFAVQTRQLFDRFNDELPRMPRGGEALEPTTALDRYWDVGGASENHPEVTNMCGTLRCLHRAEGLRLDDLPRCLTVPADGARSTCGGATV
jgi:hypothetical protein